MIALSKALHDRDMYLMLDVVTNHLAYPGAPSAIKFNDMDPFNNEKYYHKYCSLTASPNASETKCWVGDTVVSLADLRTEDEDVRHTFQVWIKNIVEKYSIDGLRLDSAGNVDTGFFPGFCDAAGIFCMGEVYSGDPTYTCPYQEVMDAILNYPAYFPLIRAFNSTEGSFFDLVQEVYNVQNSCKDGTLVGSFSENHDQPRFASYTQDEMLAKNVISFTMLADGIPIIYSGQEQHYQGGAIPYNREALWSSEYNQNGTLYKYVTSLNVLRSKAINDSSTYMTYQNKIFYNDTCTLAMRKGHDGYQIVSVLNNDGAYGTNRSFIVTANQTGFNPNQIVTDVVSCKNYTARTTGDVRLTISGGAPVVLYPAHNLVGSLICMTEGNATSTLVNNTDPYDHVISAAVRDYTYTSAVGLIAGAVVLVLGLVF